MRIDGKRALVIGGGGAGIGRAITRAFGKAGAAVVVADLDEKRAREAAAELSALGAEAWALTVDVRAPRQVEAMFVEAVKRLGGLDVLVTVVGGQVAFVPAVRLHEMADEDWDTMYEVNLRYVARAVRAALKVLMEQGTGGAIISIGSVTGFMGAPRQAACGVMKAGLLSLARTVAAEYSVDQIRMNVVAGGGRLSRLRPTLTRTLRGSRRCPWVATARLRRSQTPPPTWPRMRRPMSPVSRLSLTAECRCEVPSTAPELVQIPVGQSPDAPRRPTESPGSAAVVTRAEPVRLRIPL